MALNLGGILGAIATEVLPAIFAGDDGDVKRPAVTRARMAVTAPGGGQITPGAVGILDLIMDGASDSMVRVAARRARVGKTELFETLQAIDVIGGPGSRAFTPLEKVAVSDQIEKIFRPRPRRAISKGLRRMVKQIQFIKKEFRPIFK